MSENLAIIQGISVPPLVYWLSEVAGVLSPIISIIVLCLSGALLIAKHWDRILTKRKEKESE